MRAWAWLLVAAVVAALAVGGAALPPSGDADAPIHRHVAAEIIEHGVEWTGMRNLVTAVLLHVRGFDTFVEVVVIFTALVAVLGLPMDRAARRETPAEVPADATASAHDAVPVSPVVGFVVRTLAPFIALFALAMLWRGHETPGGGFQAAAIVGALFTSLALVAGRDKAARLLPGRARPWLQAAAPLAFAAIGALGWLLTGAFLGFPGHEAAHALRDAMGFVIELGIGVGGGVILARLFLALDGPP